MVVHRGGRGFGHDCRINGHFTGSAAAAASKVILAVLAGQSNMEGRASPDRVNTDVNVDGVYQFDGWSGDTGLYQTIDASITPLMHYSGWRDFISTPPYDRLGPGEYIARQLQTDNPGAIVLLVPTAKGTTSLVGGTPQWAPSPTNGAGGFLFENMINQTLLAIQAAQNRWSTATLVPMMFWSQGEQDASDTISYSAYQTALTNLINNSRTRLSAVSPPTGASLAAFATAPFVIGSMIPTHWQPGNVNYIQANADINHAQVSTSLAVSNVFYAKGPYPNESADNLHYSPAAPCRTYGLYMGQALSPNVTGPSVTSPSTYALQTGQTLNFLLSGSKTHQTFAINGGANAASFALSDPYITPAVQWSGAAPAAGTYAVGVQARDGGGNLGPIKTVTVTVASEVNPASFFTSGENGMVWDLSNMANLSQTIDGATPVTAVGQSVGWVKDLSPNANHWIAAANDTSRPTLQQDSDGKYYLQFGTNKVLFAATPFIQNPSVGGSGIFTSCLGVFDSAPTSAQVILATHSTTSNTPFVEALLTSATGGNLTIGMRNTENSTGTEPSLATMLDGATKHAITCNYQGSGQSIRMRDAAARPAGGGSGSYQSVAQGTFTQDFPTTRSSLGATGVATPSLFYNGRVYSGFAIGRTLSDQEIQNGENWVANRMLTAALP